MRGKVGPDRAAVSAHRRALGADGSAPGPAAARLAVQRPWCSGWRACRRPATGTTAAACAALAGGQAGRIPARRRILALPDRAALTRWDCPPDRPNPPRRWTAAHARPRAGGRRGPGRRRAGRQALRPDRAHRHRPAQGQGQSLARIRYTYPRLAESGPYRGNVPSSRGNGRGPAQCPDRPVLPPLSLGAFAALTARSALVICNDSGVSHVAAAASARQLTLFGVTRPGRTGPWSPRAVCVGAEDAWPPEDEVERQARRLLDGQQ